MKHNSLVIYSNGMTAFNRLYNVEGELQISIPFKKSHIADFLASYNLFGNVEVKQPPTYTPENAGKSKLILDKDNDTTNTLLSQLRGAAVKITKTNSRTVEGLVLGTDEWEEERGTHMFSYKGVVVFTSNCKLMRVSFNDILDIEFTQEEVKTEIEKALVQALQSIKPDSTYINMTLSAEESQEALLQYVIPTASWSISYRLIKKENKKFVLEGYAQIHNNTDDDWKDTYISVVVGEPYTFACDIAEQKIPTRQVINFIKEKATGGQSVEYGIGSDDGLESMKSGGLARSAGQSFAASCDSGGSRAKVKAKTAEVVSVDVGDFTVFSSSLPLTVLSNRSFPFKVFERELETGKTVLYYKYNPENPTRASRCVKFTNETEYSLGRGPCSVYNGEWYEGEGDLDASKPGDSRLLPHAQENNVLVKYNRKETEQKVVCITIKDGIAVTETSIIVETVYVFQNNSEEPFEVEIAHANALNQSNAKIETTLNTSVIEHLPSGGSKLACFLPQKTKDGKPKIQTVVVTETFVHKTNVILDTQWLRNVLVSTNNPSGNDPAVQECLHLKEKVDNFNKKINLVKQKITVQVEKIADLDKTLTRLRENIKILGATSEEAQESRQRLLSIEKEITGINEGIVKLREEEIPDLEKQRDTAQHNLETVLKKLIITWVAD